MADLSSLWPAGAPSGEFLKSSTRNFLSRFSGNPPSSSQIRSSSLPGYSRPADPPESVKKRMFADRLSRMRREIESKTKRLNDPSFKVTEAWLFEFANQHAEYMEKATSSAGVYHDFRSTTDLFQHVLQHPSVLKLIGDWQPSNAAAQEECSPERDEEEKPKAAESPSSPIEGSEITDSPAATDAGVVDEAKVLQSTPEVKPLSESPCADEAGHSEGNSEVATPKSPGLGAGLRKAGQQRSHSQTSLLRHRASWPAPPSAGEASELMQKLRQRQARSSCPGLGSLGTSLHTEDELTKKLRQRANSTSWQGLSPRSQRLAAKSSSSRDSTIEVPGGLAERRKLLETKLSSCGFQKAAASGGA